MGVNVRTSELDPGSRSQGNVDWAVATALGALGVDKPFTTVTITSDAASHHQYPEFMATVEGTLNGIQNLQPPRELVDISYTARDRSTQAYITIRQKSV